MANGWSLERRQRQAQRIAQWQPWKKSTGPRTAQGKRIASRNATRHGYYARTTLEFCAVLRRHGQWLKALRDLKGKIGNELLAGWLAGDGVLPPHMGQSLGLGADFPVNLGWNSC